MYRNPLEDLALDEQVVGPQRVTSLEAVGCGFELGLTLDARDFGRDFLDEIGRQRIT